MTFKMQDVVDRARIPLNDSNSDDTKRRFNDARLLKEANHGLLTMYRLRPDLWYDNWTGKPTGAAALSDNFPLDPEWLQPLADYVVSRASMNDDEFVDDARAAGMLKLFTGQLG